MGTVQSAGTLRLQEELIELLDGRGRVVLKPAPYEHPDFPKARTGGPLLAQVDVGDHDLYGQERFGPIAFVITCDDAEQALEQASRDAREHGAITAP